MLKTENFSSSISLWKWRCSQDYWTSLTFEYSQLWNIALPTSLLGKETMVTIKMIEEHLVTVSLFISAWLSGTIELSSMLTSSWPTASSSSNSNSFFYYFLLGFKKTPEICKIVKNYFISHRLVIGIESVSTLSPHPTETGFNFLLSNHWGT